MARCYFLREDIAALEVAIEQLRKKIKELGKEQGEAARQSTENFGHDDACQEAVYHERNLTMSRLRDLQKVLSNATIANPEGPFEKVRLGATVELVDGRTFKIGSFMVLADYDVTNISYVSPLAQALMHRKEGDEIEFRNKLLVVKRVS